MKPRHTRLLLTTKDVAAITGKSTRHAKRLMAQVRKQNNKPPYSSISIYEFCNFTGLPEEQVKQFLE